MALNAKNLDTDITKWVQFMVYSSKELPLVHPKEYQSWVFIGRIDVEAETPILWATWCKELTHLKRPWCWERLRAEGEGNDRGWDGWMVSPTQWTWVWVNSGSWWWTGRPACCSSCGRKESDTNGWLNWTDSVHDYFYVFLNDVETLV